MARARAQAWRCWRAAVNSVRASRLHRRLHAARRSPPAALCTPPDARPAVGTPPDACRSLNVARPRRSLPIVNGRKPLPSTPCAHPRVVFCCFRLCQAPRIAENHSSPLAKRAPSRAMAHAPASARPPALWLMPRQACTSLRPATCHGHTLPRTQGHNRVRPVRNAYSSLRSTA